MKNIVFGALIALAILVAGIAGNWFMFFAAIVLAVIFGFGVWLNHPWITLVPSVILGIIVLVGTCGSLGDASTQITAWTNAAWENVTGLEFEPPVRMPDKAPPSGDGFAPSAPAGPSAPMGKCEWLRQNFPQTTEGIQALGAKLADVPAERIATHVYRCTPETTVFDGFIVLGPNEGYAGSFTLAVPQGGAVDTYAAAVCTGTSQILGTATDTVRCLSGSVTAVRATYWPWLDENPPVSTGGVPAPAAAAACIDPTDLATERGWTYSGQPDAYGGLTVTVSGVDSLPADWEAITTGRVIRESDVDRGMSAGVYTVYPPYVCRQVLGYSK